MALAGMHAQGVYVLLSSAYWVPSHRKGLGLKPFADYAIRCGSARGLKLLSVSAVAIRYTKDSACGGLFYTPRSVRTTPKSVRWCQCVAQSGRFTGIGLSSVTQMRTLWWLACRHTSVILNYSVCKGFSEHSKKPRACCRPCIPSKCARYYGVVTSTSKLRSVIVHDKSPRKRTT